MRGRYGHNEAHCGTALDNAYVLKRGIQVMQTPVAARSKAWVCGLSLTGILSVLCCQVEVSASRSSARPEECYRLWSACDRQASMRRPWAIRGCCAKRKKMQWIVTTMMIMMKNVDGVHWRGWIRSSIGVKGLVVLHLKHCFVWAQNLFLTLTAERRTLTWIYLKTQSVPHSKHITSWL
jgi:hypothetical protein